MIELRKIHLQDEHSPKKAFYTLYLLETEEGYLVRKESGAAGKTLDSRTWPKPSRTEAEKMFVSIVRRKTNPTRKSPRHYQIANHQLSLF
jgi:hypothetical protein